MWVELTKKVVIIVSKWKGNHVRRKQNKDGGSKKGRREKQERMDENMNRQR